MPLWALPVAAAGLGLLGEATNPGSAPKNETVPLDRLTQSSIDSQIAGMSDDPKLAAEKLNFGIDAAPGGILEYGSSGGEATSTALKNRYKQKLGMEISNLKQSNLRNAQQLKFDKLQKIQSVLAAKNGIQAEAYQRMAEMRANEQAARSQFLSSIGSLAGTFGGYAISSMGKKPSSSGDVK